MALFNWRATNGGAFDVATDWTNVTTGQNPAATPPGAADTANLSANGGTVTGTGNVATLNFGAGPAWNLAGQVSAGNITVNDSTAIAAGGVLNLSSGTGTAIIASVNNAAGTLSITAGGQFTSAITPETNNYVLYVGGGTSVTGAVGTVTLTGGGALLDLNGNAGAVGISDTGTLNIAGGGLVKFGTLDPNALSALSLGRAGQGTVNVSGAQSTLQLSGAMYAGRASGSNGVVNVSDGGLLAETAVGSGNANNFGDGGTVNGTFVTGGSGQLNLTGGGRAVFADAVGVGGNGGNGSVSLSGGSTMSLGGVLRVGFGTTAPGGTGRVTINSGSQVRSVAAADTSSNYLSVAGSANTAGVVTVDGGGSLLDLGANGIGLGNGGTGAITVSGGGTLRSSTVNSRVITALSAGNSSGSSGSLTVTGAGSSVTAQGYAYFGRAGAGTLKVDQGGSFIGGSAASGNGTGANASFGVTIGDGTPNLDANGNPNSPLNFGGSGTAQVTNASSLHSLGSLRVGYRGTAGTLLIDTGSIALADGTVFAGSGTDRTGGSGIITVQGASTLASGGQHTLGTAGIELGNDAGTGGTINVVGAGSTVTANGDRITVGRVGGGVLSVLSGGKALSGAQYSDTEAALAVGGLAGGGGTVNVSGAGSQFIASGQAVLGGNNFGSGTVAGGTGTVNLTSGGLLQTGTMNIFSGSTLSIDGASRSVVLGDLADAGGISSNGVLLVSGNAAGGGTLNVSGGLTDLGALGALTVNMSGGTTVLRVHGLTGASTIQGMQFGETIDLSGIGQASLSGNTVTASNGSITLGAAPAGYVYTLYGDANGGTNILLNPTSPPPNAISITDATTGASGTATGDVANGGFDYVQRDYIWSGPATDNVAIRANVPNAFLRGGGGDDALQADYGSNVLDGGAGSSFLVGASGGDGGHDFFRAEAGSQPTWSTIVNFHQGDTLLVSGFHANLSTTQFTASEGVAGFTGATLHAEINGPGTGVDASVTFAGIDLATVQQHFSYAINPQAGGGDALTVQFV